MKMLRVRTVRITCLIAVVLFVGYNYIFNSQHHSIFSSKLTNAAGFFVRNNNFPQISSLNLLCLVMTTSRSVDKHAAILDTWGTVCDNLLFLTGNATESHLVQLNTSVYNLQLKVLDHYDNTWMKIRAAFNFIFHKWMKPFDWLLRIDDDGFLFVDNFRTFVENLDKEKPLMYGAYYANYLGGYIGTGPGILLNHMAIEQLKQCFNNNSCCDTQSYTHFDDVNLGACLRMAKISFGKSSDSQNRMRFIPLPPNYMLENPPGSLFKWFQGASAYPVTPGFNCCSDDLIALHYLNPAQMRRYHELAIRYPDHPRNLYLLFNKTK